MYRSLWYLAKFGSADDETTRPQSLGSKYRAKLGKQIGMNNTNTNTKKYAKLVVGDEGDCSRLKMPGRMCVTG